jgi:hypothetical protein
MTPIRTGLTLRQPGEGGARSRTGELPSLDSLEVRNMRNKIADKYPLDRWSTAATTAFHLTGGRRRGSHGTVTPDPGGRVAQQAEVTVACQ